MDGMVRLVVDALGLQAPPAKGSDIVIGQECQATNRFLQLLALVAHSHQTQQQQRPQDGDTCDQDDNLRNQVWAAQTKAVQPPVVAVAASKDGTTWEEVEVFRQGSDETADESNKSKNSGITSGADTLALTAANPTATRYLRVAAPAEGCGINPTGKSTAATPRSTTVTTAAAAATPAAPAFGPDYSTSEQGGEAGITSTAAKAFRVRIVGVGSISEEHAGKGRVRGAAGEADGRNSEGERVQASRKEGVAEEGNRTSFTGREAGEENEGGGRERGKRSWFRKVMWSFVHPPVVGAG